MNLIESVNKILGTKFDIKYYKDGEEILFDLKTTCNILKIKIRTAKNQLDTDEYRLFNRISTVTEEGILVLILGSKNYIAKLFKKFIIKLIKTIGINNNVNEADITEFKAQSAQVISRLNIQLELQKNLTEQHYFQKENLINECMDKNHIITDLKTDMFDLEITNQKMRKQLDAYHRTGNIDLDKVLIKIYVICHDKNMYGDNYTMDDPPSRSLECHYSLKLIGIENCVNVIYIKKKSHLTILKKSIKKKCSFNTIYIIAKELLYR